LGNARRLAPGESAKLTVWPNDATLSTVGIHTNMLTVTADTADGPYTTNPPINLRYYVLNYEDALITFNDGVTATVDGVTFDDGVAFFEFGSVVTFSAMTPPSPHHVAVWAVGPMFRADEEELELQSGDSSDTFVYELHDFIEVEVRWLHVGAATSGGTGHVSSADLTWLARNAAGHDGFELADRRVGNLAGLDRDPLLADVTRIARWLVGYNFATLRQETINAG